MMPTFSCQMQASSSKLKGTPLPRSTHPSCPSMTHPPHIYIHPNAPADCIGQLGDPHSICSWLEQVHVWSKYLHTQCLSQAIPAKNVEGTLNEADYITKVIDLIVQYGDHSEQATFHVTGISQTTIILGHM